MIHPLDGARLKVIRAQEHLDSLNAEAQMFLDEHPYRFDSEHYPEHWWLKPIITTTPPMRLSTIIGDCVVNARAALDYIVWQLAIRHAKPALDPTEKKDRKLFSMPIYNSAPVPKDGLSNRLYGLAKRGIPATALTLIQDIQPHNAGYEPLWWLHELVNEDKHRMPLLTIGAFSAAEVTIETGNCRYLVRSALIKNGVAINTTPEFKAILESDDVKMDTQAAVYVAFQNVSMPQEPVDRTLEQIIETVANVIPRFDRFFD